MASSATSPPTGASNATDSWKSLVHRSIQAWERLGIEHQQFQQHELKQYTDLDQFLLRENGLFIYWFFHRRPYFLLQKALTKWSRDRLDEYILLPSAPDFVTRAECFFVSHFWHSSEHPDPTGKYLRLTKSCLRKQKWSYIWVDWTCAPQHPRSPAEERYFLRTLKTMSGIIRNCGFSYFYPPWEPRLWILYEIVEYWLTCDGFGGFDDPNAVTPDIAKFHEHIKEMFQTGVRATIEKYGYKCTHERDRNILVPWLELLVLLRKHNPDIITNRRIMEPLTFMPVQEILVQTLDGLIAVYPYEGKLQFKGQCHTFTPFPVWDDETRTAMLKRTSTELD